MLKGTMECRTKTKLAFAPFSRQMVSSPFSIVNVPSTRWICVLKFGLYSKEKGVRPQCSTSALGPDRPVIYSTPARACWKVVGDIAVACLWLTFCFKTYILRRFFSARDNEKNDYGLRNLLLTNWVKLDHSFRRLPKKKKMPIA
ncbi:hypothetical protein DQ04_16001000 [Trypanosoma grayi]|uniref:hypothetical protein n=1 Tax=Trypanosoma grayi TaxID=71804 RepID=UPI0004F40E68|nr:hypothetical protein DQ04_16001000 [Trypanosoma grayi]KEG06090.1 hypothetical protein DQ04_16001000 [Trypanosoma grayi]